MAEGTGGGGGMRREGAGCLRYEGGIRGGEFEGVSMRG